MYEYKIRLKRNSRKPFMVQEKPVNYEATKRMNNSHEIVRMMNDAYGLQELADEHTYLITMNTRCDINAVFLIGAGTVNLCPVSVKSVFTNALLAGASAIVLVHNHPSGDATPSDEDYMLAKRVATAGELIGVYVADFIIVGNGTYVSFRDVDENLLKPMEPKKAWKI